MVQRWIGQLFNGICGKIFRFFDYSYQSFIWLWKTSKYFLHNFSIYDIFTISSKLIQYIHSLRHELIYSLHILHLQTFKLFSQNLYLSILHLFYSLICCCKYFPCLICISFYWHFLKDRLFNSIKYVPQSSWIFPFVLYIIIHLCIFHLS